MPLPCFFFRHQFLRLALSHPSRSRVLSLREEKEREKARPQPLLFSSSSLLLEVALGSPFALAYSDSSLDGFRRKERRKEKEKESIAAQKNKAFAFFNFDSSLFVFAMLLQIFYVLMEAASRA